MRGKLGCEDRRVRFLSGGKHHALAERVDACVREGAICQIPYKYGGSVCFFEKSSMIKGERIAVRQEGMRRHGELPGASMAEGRAVSIGRCKRVKSKLLKVLAVTLAVALGSVAAFAATVPADVQGTDCEKAVTKLVEENIITGDTDGLYHPDKNLTRAEVSTLIAKAVDPKAADSKATVNYSDMAGYGWAAPFIGLMTEKQIAKGYPDGTFKPGANVKVSELAAFVIRACGINDGDLEGTWPDNYMKKADEMDLFDAVEGKDHTSMLDPNVPATKEQAAIAVYNALDQIRGSGISMVFQDASAELAFTALP